MFFANDLLLAVNFMFILDYRTDVRHKANSSNFFNSGSKWVIKQQRQLTISTTHLVQELLMNVQCSGGSKSFVGETRALKMRSIVAGHQKLTTTNSEPLAKLILLKLHEKVPQEFNVSRSMVFWHLNQIGKVKKLDKWVPDELTENFFKLSFLDQIVICDEKCILFDNF